MKMIFMAFMLALLPFSAWSQKKPAVSLRMVKIFPDGKKFVVSYAPGIVTGTILTIRQNGVTLVQAPVLKCKTKSCLATVAGESKLDPTQLSTYVALAPVAQTAAKLGTITYGSPLGGGIRLGLQQKWSPQLSFGGKVGHIASASSNVELKSNMISGLATYHVLNFSDTYLVNVVGELGWAFTQLSFKGGSTVGAQKENVYVVALAGEGIYNFNKQWGAGAQFGYTKNGLKASYSSSTGINQNPYGKGLVFFEFGVYYTF